MLIAVVFILLWLGLSLTFGAWRPDRRPLAQRLRPYRHWTIGDEAQEWLKRQARGHRRDRFRDRFVPK